VKKCYSTDSYGAAIKRACERLGIEVWSPNRLRHTAATQMRAEAGLDASWALLGHERPDTTLIYAEQRLQSQIELARRFG
jgi:integrase